MKKACVPWVCLGVAVACTLSVHAQPVAKRGSGTQAKAATMGDEAIERKLQRAYAQLEAGDTAQARTLFSQLLEQAPRNPQVVGGMGIVELRLGQHAQAQALFAQALGLDEKHAAQWQGLLRTAEFWVLMAQAHTLRDAGRLQDAEASARAALALDASNAQALALLATLRDAQGDAAEAERLYRQALSDAAANDSALRGLVVLMTRQGRSAEALALLDGEGASANVAKGPYTDLRVAVLRDLALHHAKAGQRAQAVRLLQDALALAPADPWVRFDLANLLLPGESQRAGELVQAGLVLAPTAPEMLFAAALYFAKLEQYEQVWELVEKIPLAERSEPMARLQRQVRARRALAQALFKCQQAKLEAASTDLELAADMGQDDPDLLSSVAMAQLECGQTEQALALMRAALARQSPPGLALRLRYLAVLARAQQDVELRAELARTAADPLPDAERAELARMAFDLDLKTAYAELAAGRLDQAAAIADQYARTGSKNMRIALLQGSIARSKKHYGEALGHFLHAKELQSSQGAANSPTHEAEDAIAALLGRREWYISAGGSVLRKPGTAGVSDLTLTDVPLEMRYPVGLQGHVFVHMDHTRVQAGTLDASDTYALSRYGKVQALAPAGPVNRAETEARGTALTLGFESDAWRIDAGTTPLGFAVEDGTGGVRWAGDCSGATCTMELSKRAVTESLLAFAGAKDPVSGEVWGGVRNTGLEGRVRGNWHATEGSVRLGYHLLQGRNVLDNRQWDFGAEIGRMLAQSSTMQLRLGLAYTYWAFEHDLNYFTFGHGGYYSPQTYHALGIPWRWNGRNGPYVYQVSGSVSVFTGFTKDMPFYPTSSQLQSLAGNPMHTGGSFSASGYSLDATVERRLESRWILGGRLAMGRAPYYAPNAVSIYLRYQWEPDKDTVPLSPRPARAYARY